MIISTINIAIWLSR